MRILTVKSEENRHTASFTIAHQRDGYLPMRATLYRDYEKQGDGTFWAMQSAACIASSYSQAEKDETRRLNREPALQDGEIVQIEGGQYRVRRLGDYSNCAIFDPIHEDIAEIDRLRGAERHSIQERGVSTHCLREFDRRTTELKFAKQRQICAVQLEGVGQQVAL